MSLVLKLFSRQYGPNYGCSEFASEFYTALHGLPAMPSFNELLATDRLVVTDHPTDFVVAFGRTGVQHVGSLYQNKVVHLTNRGVHAVPLAFFLQESESWRFYALIP